MSQINLLPESYAKRRFRNRVDAVCILLFGMVMGGVLIAGTLQGRTFRETQAQYETTCRRFEREIQSLDEYLRLRERKRSLLETARVISTLEASTPRSYLISLVTKSLPEELRLSVVDISEKISITAQTQADAGGPPSGRRGGTRVVRSTDSPPGEPPQPPASRMIVRLGGYAAGDTAVTQLYTTLDALPITDDVKLRHTRESQAGDRTCREFQIDWELKENTDALDYLPALLGIVEPTGVAARLLGEKN